MYRNAKFIPKVEVVMNNALSLNHLYPDFRLLFNDEMSLEKISAIFCAFLIVIFVSFMIKPMYISFIKSKRKISFYFQLLDGVEKGKLVASRRQIEMAAIENNDHGQLWKEFDESLIVSSDGLRLFNTLDASHFFNTHTLARGITESRMLAAVPGFLTAIGVIGTFTGLLLGIGQLDFGQADPAKLKEGMEAVVKGASIAFMTSVWGVSLSVIFNIVEKALESHIREKISSLQDKVDYLYTRINVEQSLIEISHSSQSSQETLMGLAEKIGNKMQEAVVQMSESMQSGIEESLRKVMAPAIEKLVQASTELADKQASGSQEVLQDLIHQFTTGLAQEGNKQQELMAETSSAVQGSIGAWGTDMRNFIQKLDEQFTNIHAESQKRNEFLEHQLNNYNTSQKEQMETLNTQLTSVISGLTSDVETMHQKTVQTDQERSQVFEDQLLQLTEFHESMMKEMQGTIGQHVNSTNGLIEQGQALSQKISEMENKLLYASDKMESAGGKLSDAASSLHDTIDTLGLTNTVLSQSIKESTQSNIDVAIQNKSVASDFHKLFSEISELKSDYSRTTSLLNESAKNAESTFDRLVNHQESYKAALKSHVEDIASQLNGLLKNYTQEVEGQIRARMQTWDKETANYTTAMQGVVGMMQELVDDIESRDR